MKRFVLILTAGVLLLELAGCARKEDPAGLSGVETEVSLAVCIGTAMNKADISAGDEVCANRCILQLYHDGEPYGSRHVVPAEEGRASFPLTLVSGQTYEALVWADWVGLSGGTAVDADTPDLYYATEAFPEVSIRDIEGYFGNDPKKDAFYACRNISVDASGTISPIVLSRPFGQLNIITTDIADVQAALRPGGVKMSFANLPVAFDMRTGTVVRCSGVQVEDASLRETAGAADAAEQHLSFDYIFAPVAGEYAMEALSIHFYMNGGSAPYSSYDFPADIPLRANWRTNVRGRFLTGNGGMTVSSEGENENILTTQ